MSEMSEAEKSRRMALRAARDWRHDAIRERLSQPMFEAVSGNLPSRALALCAEEDVHAAIGALVEDLDDEGLTVVSRHQLGDYLLTHVGGDESEAWQAGHNYAMREAARLIREGADLLTNPAQPNHKST